MEDVKGVEGPGGAGDEVLSAEDAYVYRHRPLKSKYTKAEIDTVFARGKQADGTVRCYLCGEELERDKTLCDCPVGPDKKRKRKSCACGAWEIEHVVAKSNGPEFHCLGNLLPACVTCNCKSWKGERSLSDLVANKGMRPQLWSGDCSELCTKTRETIVNALETAAANDEERWTTEVAELRPTLPVLEVAPAYLDSATWKHHASGSQGEVMRVTRDTENFAVAIKVLTGVERSLRAQVCLFRELAAHQRLKHL
jgi:hypothetical protein